MTARTAKYPPHTSLRETLNQAVARYFEERGIDPHGGLRMWLKTATIIGWTIASYILLVFVAESWWQVLLTATSLGLAVAGIGFNVQHDGGHGSYSGKRFFNRLAAWTLDLTGGSSYMWNQKHNVLHHHYTNVEGHDDDLCSEPFLRMAHWQKRRWYHRFQHYYIWPLYTMLPPKWQFHDDFQALIRGRIGVQRIPRPRGWSLAGLFLGKAAFYLWAVVVPFWMHTWWHVLLVYGFVCLVLGVTLGTVFQLAHCIEEADVTLKPAASERLPLSWVEHQLATTADFSPRNRLLAWYLGGLNFQVEHHLFPRVSHVHYPKLAAIVRDVCERAGVVHHTHRSVWKALRSHVRYMRALGRPQRVYS